MALEIMVATPAIRNLIRENKIHQIYSAIQASVGVGMQTMNQGLASLVKRRLISAEEALRQSALPDELTRMMAGNGAGKAGAGVAATVAR
jgi:twitching motility protein PilT